MAAGEERQIGRGERERKGPQCWSWPGRPPALTRADAAPALRSLLPWAPATRRTPSFVFSSRPPSPPSSLLSHQALPGVSPEGVPKPAAGKRAGPGPPACTARGAGWDVGATVRPDICPSVRVLGTGGEAGVLGSADTAAFFPRTELHGGATLSTPWPGHLDRPPEGSRSHEAAFPKGQEVTPGPPTSLHGEELQGCLAYGRRYQQILISAPCQENISRTRITGPGSREGQGQWGGLACKNRPGSFKA